MLKSAEEVARHIYDDVVILSDNTPEAIRRIIDHLTFYALQEHYKWHKAGYEDWHKAGYEDGCKWQKEQDARIATEHQAGGHQASDAEHSNQNVCIRNGTAREIAAAIRNQSRSQEIKHDTA